MFGEQLKTVAQCYRVICCSTKNIQRQTDRTQSRQRRELAAVVKSVNLIRHVLSDSTKMKNTDSQILQESQSSFLSLSLSLCSANSGVIRHGVDNSN